LRVAINAAYKTSQKKDNVSVSCGRLPLKDIGWHE